MGIWEEAGFLKLGATRMWDLLRVVGAALCTVGDEQHPWPLLTKCQWYPQWRHQQCLQKVQMSPTGGVGGGDLLSAENHCCTTNTTSGFELEMKEDVEEVASSLK